MEVVALPHCAIDNCKPSAPIRKERAYRCHALVCWAQPAQAFELRDHVLIQVMPLPAPKADSRSTLPPAAELCLETRVIASHLDQRHPLQAGPGCRALKMFWFKPGNLGTCTPANSGACGRVRQASASRTLRDSWRRTRRPYRWPGSLGIEKDACVYVNHDGVARARHLTGRGLARGRL